MKRNKKPTGIPDAINFGMTKKEFTTIPNEIIRNPELSCKAKTVLFILLSNQTGWKSYQTELLKKMKEGRDTLTTALRELEQAGYLKRMRVKDKKTNQFTGSLWAYTDVPGEFNLPDCLDGVELFEQKPRTAFPRMGKPQCGFSTYGESTTKNIKGKEDQGNKNITISDVKTPEDDRYKNLPKLERSKVFLPLAIKLKSIVQDNKNVTITHIQLKAWSNDLRRMYEENKIDYPRINAALEWYEDNYGASYVPVIQSGSALREKFLSLDDAMKREKNPPTTSFREKYKKNRTGVSDEEYTPHKTY